MPLYESIVIVRQDVTAAQVDALADGFSEILTKNGGSIERREYWGLRTLAYRIKKNRKGHYVLFNIDAPSESVQAMERNIRLNEDVLRYMTIRIDEARPDPSPIMQGKGDRERDRADRSQRHGGPRGRPDRSAAGAAPAATAAASTDKPASKPAGKPADKPAAEPATEAAPTESKED